MPKNLAEPIARVLQPADARDSSDQGVALLREALELYSPSNLVELYMAVRARAASGNPGFEGLIDALRVAADGEPHLALDAFAARGSA